MKNQKLSPGIRVYKKARSDRSRFWGVYIKDGSLKLFSEAGW